MAEVNHVGDKVQVFELQWEHTKNVKKETHEAYFLGFSTDYEELQIGIGQYPAAIIELHDGSVDVVPATMIKFI